MSAEASRGDYVTAVVVSYLGLLSVIGEIRMSLLVSSKSTLETEVER